MSYVEKSTFQKNGRSALIDGAREGFSGPALMSIAPEASHWIFSWILHWRRQKARRGERVAAFENAFSTVGRDVAIAADKIIDSHGYRVVIGYDKLLGADGKFRRVGRRALQRAEYLDHAQRSQQSRAD